MEHVIAAPMQRALDWAWTLVRNAIASGRAVPLFAMLVGCKVDDPSKMVFPSDLDTFTAMLAAIVAQEQPDAVIVVCEAAMMDERADSPPPTHVIGQPKAVDVVMVNWRERGSATVGAQFACTRPYDGNPRGLGHIDQTIGLASNRWLDRVFETTNSKLH